MIVMSNWILLPPVAAGIFITTFVLIARLMKKISYRGEPNEGARASYACGEESPKTHCRPEYGQFFSYAFFFTIMHVVALILATVPSGNSEPYLIAAFYIVAVFVGLRSLLRNES